MVHFDPPATSLVRRLLLVSAFGVGAMATPSSAQDLLSNGTASGYIEGEGQSFEDSGDPNETPLQGGFSRVLDGAFPVPGSLGFVSGSLRTSQYAAVAGAEASASRRGVNERTLTHDVGGFIEFTDRGLPTFEVVSATAIASTTFSFELFEPTPFEVGLAVDFAPGETAGPLGYSLGFELVDAAGQEVAAAAAVRGDQRVGGLLEAGNYALSSRAFYNAREGEVGGVVFDVTLRVGSAVPEPAGATVLTLGAIGLLRRRRTVC